MLSDSNCRTSLPRLTPNASRTAISRRLPAARANKRFATLAHAINSTSPTTAIRIFSGSENSYRISEIPRAAGVSLASAFRISAAGRSAGAT